MPQHNDYRKHDNPLLAMSQKESISSFPIQYKKIKQTNTFNCLKTCHTEQVRQQLTSCNTAMHLITCF